MAESHFCLGVSGVGGGWGRRHTLAAMHGCVPVMIMDGSSLELDELIPWDKMSVRVAEKDIDRLPTILDDVMADAERMRSMRAELACVWPRFLWSSIEGSHAGEDGTDDAFASVMEILRRRLGGRGAGDAVVGASRGDDEDVSASHGGENGGDGGDGGEMPRTDDVQMLKLAPSLSRGEAPSDAPTPSPKKRAAAKVRKRHETSPGWHPSDKKKASRKQKKIAAKGTSRFRKLLETATDENTAAAAVAVVKPMHSACTRSSSSAAGNGRVPPLCYSSKQKQPQGRGPGGEGTVGLSREW